MKKSKHVHQTQRITAKLLPEKQVWPASIRAWQYLQDLQKVRETYFERWVMISCSILLKELLAEEDVGLKSLCVFP